MGYNLFVRLDFLFALPYVHVLGETLLINPVIFDIYAFYFLLA